MSQIRMSNFQMIPPVIKNLLIVNVLVFFAQNVFNENSSFDIGPLLALHDIRSEYFRPHQLITHMFMHGGFFHLLLNMFVLWMFGSMLENVWGSKRFLIFYIVCGLGAAALHLGVLFYELTPYVNELRSLPPAGTGDAALERYRENLTFAVNSATVGASGAVFGCLAAYAYLFPNNVLYIYGVLPIKAKWFVLIYAGFELFAGLRNTAGDNVAHWAHLGGALVGFLLVVYWNRTNRQRFY